MKKFKFVLILLIVLFFYLSCKKYNQKSLLKGSKRVEKNGITILYLSGNPYQIGFQHGFLLKKELRLMEKLIDNEVKEAISQIGIDLPHFILPVVNFSAKVFINRTLLKEVPREYLDELKGISDAAGISLSKLYILNMGYDLEENFMNLSCSSFSILFPSSQTILHGRNLDWENPKIVSKTNTIFYLNPEKGYNLISIAPAGFVGVLTGMNDKKISGTINASLAKDTTFKGIPTFFLLRKVIQYSDSLERAIESIKNSKRTVGNNFLISDGSQNLSVLLEATANKLSIRFPQNNFLWATNHFEARGTNILQKDISAEWDNNTRGRFNRLSEIFSNLKSKKVDEYDGLSILRDRINWETNEKDSFCPQSLCSEKTSQSVLFLPAKLEFWVSNLKSSNACSGQYLKFSVESKKIKLKKVESMDEYTKTENFGAFKKYIEALNHLKNSDFKSAKMYFMKALQLEKNSPTALRIIGINFCNVFKDYKNSIKYLVKAKEIASIKGSEFYPYALNNYFLGKSLIGAGDYKSAIKVLSEIGNQKADKCRLAWTEIRLGQANDALNLRQNAIKHYKKSLSFNEKSSKKVAQRYLKISFNPKKNRLENRSSSGFFCMY